MKALFKLVLKGSLVGAIAMATATGCGDDSSDGDGDAGEGNSGGAAAGTNNTSGAANAGDSSNGGSTSNAGAPTDGGTDAGAGGTGAVAGEGGGGGASEGGAGPNPFGGAPSEGGAAYDGPAVAKFCNTLTFDPDGEDPDGAGGEGSAPPEPTTLRLEIGEGQDMVSFTATTGECVPADGEACKEIPTGAAVQISLFDVDDDADPLDFGTVEVLESEQWILYTDIAEGQPIWNGGTLNPTFECSAFTYDDI